MDKVCDKEFCTGCTLCVAQCPRQCITMEDKGVMGHLYPVIETSICIDCGKCQRSCPVLHQPEKRRPKEAFAAWSKDDIEYKSSTSGGIASILAREIITRGGVVYGCAMLPDINVRHLRITSDDEVWKLKGSKYVQSSITDIIPQLKDDVVNGIPTLFIGTPCQVAAIRKIFKKQPENLYLVDLICHGIPSVDMLKMHLKRKCSAVKYDNIIFRDENGKYCVSVIHNGKVEYKENHDRQRKEGWFISSFFEGFIYRDSCYSCQYARPERCSDMTIGDFWGLGKKAPIIDMPSHANGCSVILPITTKGMELLKDIRSKLYAYQRPVEEAIEGNSQLNAPVHISSRIKLFRLLFPWLSYRAYKLTWADVILKYDIIKLIKSIIK